MASSSAVTTNATCTPPPTSSTTPLNASCTVPWSGAELRPALLRERHHAGGVPHAQGQDGCVAIPPATTAAGYLGGTAAWRTDLYTSRGTLLTLRESIALNKRLGVKHTPELKAGNPTRVNAVFGSQAKYAQAMIDEFKRAGVNPRDVWPQSFNLATCCTGSATSRASARRPCISTTSIPARAFRA